MTDHVVTRGTDYFWCHMSQGNRHTVGYIEARGAVVGKLVELLDLGGLWKVDRVSNGVTKAFVREQERAFKAFQGSISKGGGQIDA
mgnify:FL=1